MATDELVKILERIDELSPVWNRNGTVTLSNGAQVIPEWYVSHPTKQYRIIVKLDGQEVVNYCATDHSGDYDYCDAWYKRGMAPIIEQEKRMAERVAREAKENFWGK